MIKKICKKYSKAPQSIKASIWFMICSLLQKAISFITIPIFTRLLSSEEYGFYSVYMSWENILMIFATLNLSYQVFNNGMIKYKNDRNGYASSMVGLTLVSSIIMFIIYIIFSKQWSNYTNVSFMYMILMITDMIFVGILGIFTVRERYDFKYKIIVLLTVISMITNPILGIIFVLYFKDKVLGRIVSIVIINVIVGIIASIILYKRSKKIINLDYWKYALKIDFPLVPHYLSMVLLNSSDRIMIGSMLGNSFVAYYSIAYNVAMIMQILINSINSSFNPWLYQKLEKKEYSNIRKNSSLLISGVALVTILPMFFGPEVIYILGSSEYASAANIMSIISASVFMIYLYSLFISVELFFEKSKLVMIGSVFTTIINIILNYLFINKYGYIAAGYTTLISYIVLTIFHYLNIKKIMKENKIKRIYDVNVIVLVSVGVIVVSLIMQLLYDTFIIRYIILAIIFILLILKKDKIITFVRKLKQKE